MVLKSCRHATVVMIAMLLLVAGASTNSPGANGDCSQPVTNGPKPVATDCLRILQVAVGSAVCVPECICQPKGTPPAAATDALLCLQKAVGQPVLLKCPCAISTTTTVSVTTTTTTTTSTTLTTLPPPQWGLACFATDSCGTFCGGSSCTCDSYLESIGVPPAMAMCFFDCMDALGTVESCRASCGGPTTAPPCDTTVTGSGGFAGIVTGPGACEPSGFAATVSAGGSSAEVKRFEVSFTTAIDESTMFDGPPPACAAGCPGSGCVATAVKPLPDHVRVQIGAPPSGSEPEVCDREGVPMTACKFGPADYVLLFDTPVCTASPVDITLFMSCHIGDGGGGFLHFSTGDFYFTGSF